MKRPIGDYFTDPEPGLMEECEAEYRRYVTRKAKEAGMTKEAWLAWREKDLARQRAEILAKMGLNNAD